MMTRPPFLELLSPAKNADFGIEAINHGADAVYIGGPDFGARAGAGNSLADIERLVKTAQEAGVNFFDHPDIYGGAKSEEQFAAALQLTPAQREQIFLQT